MLSLLTQQLVNHLDISAKQNQDTLNQLVFSWIDLDVIESVSNSWENFITAFNYHGAKIGLTENFRGSKKTIENLISENLSKTMKEIIEEGISAINW